MLKLLICLFTAVATGALLLQLREQRLNLTYQTNRLHNQIEATQAELWNQQLNIAINTAPDALAIAVKGQALATPTSGDQPVKVKRSWLDNSITPAK